MRGWILGVTLAVLMPGCLASFDRLARELDHLDLPADYVLLEEDVSGDSVGYSGSPRVIRRYRAPRSFEATCEEIRVAARDFSRQAPRFHRQDGWLVDSCSVSFERGQFHGFITAKSPPDPEQARAHRVEPWDHVRVVVQILD